MMHLNVIQLAVILVFSFSGYVHANSGSPEGFAATPGYGLQTTHGGQLGNIVVAKDFKALQNYAEDAHPYTILVRGTITAPFQGAHIQVKPNKSIIGLGNSTTLSFVELDLLFTSNVIIRNLTFLGDSTTDSSETTCHPYNGVRIGGSHHIWIDHCRFLFSGDELLDFRTVSDFVTVSWVHFSNRYKDYQSLDHENGDFKTTIHHCWFENVNQHKPRFDMGKSHFYNNYISNVLHHGLVASGKAAIIVENSLYENLKDPIATRDSARLYVSGLKFTNCTGSKTGNQSEKPFEPAQFYAYQLDNTSSIKNINTSQTGPLRAVANQYISTETRTPQTFGIAASPVNKSFTINGQLSLPTSVSDNYTITLSKINGKSMAYPTSSGPPNALPGSGFVLVFLKPPNR